MWKSGEQDGDIKELLSRYRPAGPRSDRWAEISALPHSQISKSERAWPWAVAAAALLAVSVGLHAAVLPPPETSSLVDAARVQAIVDQLGGSPENRTMAEWIASREAMLERERLLRASRLEPERQ
jgi:hypothetical protein